MNGEPGGVTTPLTVYGNPGPHTVAELPVSSAAPDASLRPIENCPSSSPGLLVESNMNVMTGCPYRSSEKRGPMPCWPSKKSNVMRSSTLQPSNVNTMVTCSNGGQLGPLNE